ncbi:MAG TPA: F0F1 ATP synthase subunit B [Jatrophihabitantaceae bacterium]|nr:F0F1 ATP synthase subunit B [Jatrophihabitantaceae bacterium]
MHLAEENVLVPAMGELIIGSIAFALLVFVLMRFVWPRMEQIYRERRDAIEGGIARAEAAQAEAQRTLEQYQAQLAEARNEAAQIREGARAEAQRIVEELRAQAQEESARIVARGDEQLRTQRSQVVRELRGEIGTLAVELSERIIGQRLADDAQVSTTVNSFLAELEQQDHAAANGNTP